jgi:putative aldouronate transport system substrate-binding protein
MRKALLIVFMVLGVSMVFASGSQSSGTAASSGPRRSTWLTDTKVTFDFVLQTQGNIDPNTTPFWQMMEEITNVHINWIVVSSDNWANYTSTMWASGDYPDAAIYDTNLPYYAEQGAFFPINSIWKTAMPNLTKIIQAHPEIPVFGQFNDGNVYALPGLEEVNIELTNGIWIYKPWLDKLGLAMPTTEAELINVLTAFKTRDPNGNGLADEVSFAWAPTQGWMIGMVHSWFGAMPDWYIHDARVTYSPATENYKKYVQFMNKLNTLGLFDPEVFTQDLNTFWAKGKRDPVIYGMIMDYGLYLNAGDSTYDDYVLFAPIKTGTTPSGADNSRYFKNGFKIFPTGYGPVVFADAKNPELFLKWYDTLYDPAYGVQARFGMDGVHIKKNAQGQYEQVQAVPAPYGNYIDWYFATHKQTLSYYQKSQVEPILNSNKEQVEYQVKDKFYKPYFINEAMPEIQMLASEAEKINGYPDIAKLVTDMTNQWIAGTRDIERDWSDYLRQLDQIGLKDYVAAYQAYVTRVRNQLGSAY